MTNTSDDHWYNALVDLSPKYAAIERSAHAFRHELSFTILFLEGILAKMKPEETGYHALAYRVNRMKEILEENKLG
jgi:hypothetical protein